MPLLLFTTYTLKGAFHLNQLAAQCGGALPEIPPDSSPRKRKRIVVRLSEGLERARKRKFTISKLKAAFADISRDEIEEQIAILQSHAVVVKPTNKSVELCRAMGATALEFLKTQCNYSPADLETLLVRNSVLTN